MDAFFGFYPAAIYEMEDARVSQTFTPLAHFALFTYQDEHGNWRGEKYTLWDFTLYDGVRACAFHSDESWKKIPKGIVESYRDYDKLYGKRKQFCQEEYDAFTAFLKARREQNIPEAEALMTCMNCGWLIPKRDAEVRVDVEVNKTSYRLVRSVPQWSTGLGGSSVCEQKVFKTREEALVEARYRIACRIEEKERLFLWDISVGTLAILDKIPPEYHDEVEFLLNAWTFRPGFTLRYYDGTLFYQDSWFKSPQIIWQMPKKVEE